MIAFVKPGRAMFPDAVFRLSERVGDRVYCGVEGLHVGATPVLEALETDLGFVAWRVRDWKSLGRELSAMYGIPVDFRHLRLGAETVARALTRGDLALAQIAALLLRLPDPDGRAAGQESRETKSPTSL